MPQAGRGALLFIFILVLIDSVGFGIILPVLPRLIMQLTGVGIDRAARYGGWLSFVYALMQFFFAPVLGNLSDARGRRPVLLYAVLSLGVDYLIMGLAPTIGWLFLAGAAGLIVNALLTKPRDTGVTFLIILAGVPVYLARRRWFSR